MAERETRSHAWERVVMTTLGGGGGVSSGDKVLV
jgi:hypothetical protein